MSLTVLLVACVPVGDGEAQGVGLDIRPAALTLELEAGASQTLHVDVTNNGSRTRRIEVESVGVGLGAGMTRNVELGAGQTTGIEVVVDCPLKASVKHGWIVIDDARAPKAVPVRVACQMNEFYVSEHGAGSEPDLLTWEPPLLERPSVVRVPAERSARVLELDRSKDYLVLLPKRAKDHGIVIQGGRNVVVFGGEIQIPWQGASPSIAARRGLYIVGSTGVVHVEGLLLHGEDISEGIQINAPDAVVQLQNVAVLGLRARDQVGFTDNHPDVVQTFGNVRHLRIDRLTGTTDYQGLFLSATYNGPAHGPVDLKRVNIVGGATARYLLWFRPNQQSGQVTLEDVWVSVPASRAGGIGRAVWPDVNGRDPSRAIVSRESDGVRSVSWPSGMRPAVVGQVKEGVPPGGDFVPQGAVGVGYRSPGYGVEGL